MGGPTGGGRFARICRSEWLPVALGVVMAAAALVVWVELDGFMDREEANHVSRAVETYDALFGSASSPPSFRRLAAARADQTKVWYGWPSYLAPAIAWRALGRTYDNGVLSNVPCLIALVVLAAAIGQCLDKRTAPMMALFQALLPGALVWGHFFNVTLPVTVLAYLAVLTLLWAGRRPARAGPAFLAGLACALATIAKLTTVFFWGPVALLLAGRGLADAPRRVATMKGLTLFALGLVPAAVHFVSSFEVLRFWTGHVHHLYAGGSTWRAFRQAARLRTLEVFLPPHLLFAAAGFAALVARRPTRWLALALIAWPVPTLLGVFLLGGFPATTRDMMPLGLPAALLASRAFAEWSRGPRLASLWSLLGFGGLFLAVNFFGWTAPGRAFAWLTPPIDGSTTVRLRPSPPILDATIAGLRATLAPDEGSRCACLPITPYPVRSRDPRPVVLVDHAMIGPENLAMPFAISREPLPWTVGYVPYPLPSALLRTVIGCASAVLRAEPPMPAEYMGAEARAAEGRALLEGWGERHVIGRWPGFGTVTILTARDVPLCQISEQQTADAWVARVAGPSGEGGYYGEFLRLLLTGDDPQALPARLDSVRQHTESRQRRLAAGEDSASTMFGENYLASSLLAMLPRIEFVGQEDGGARGPSDVIRLRNGSALPLHLQAPLLTPRGFALAWGKPRFPRRLRPGETARGTVVVANRSLERWPSVREAHGPAYAVRLGCRVLEAGGLEVGPAQRGDLESAVAPGALTAIRYQFDAPTRRGAYRLECDLVQELHSWFSAHGSPKMTADFSVE